MCQYCNRAIRILVEGFLIKVKESFNFKTVSWCRVISTSGLKALQGICIVAWRKNEKMIHLFLQDNGSGEIWIN